MACISDKTINLGDCLNFQNSTANQAYPNFASLINNILPNLYIAASLIIFFFIFLGGFTIIANSGNPDKQNEGKKTITGALIGFLIVILSYFIIQIIEIITGIPILHSNL